MSIELINVSYTYSKSTTFAKQALEKINFRIGSGEWVAVMGTTGSGKSTLLQHLNGLLKPQTGEVLLNNVNIHSSSETLRQARQKVGLVFQYPEHQLFGSSVWEEIAYGPLNFGYTDAEIDSMVSSAMESIELDFEKYRDRSPYNLSGGEKRRVALAGVLASKPSVIILDEPTAGLDFQGRQRLIDTIVKFNQDQGITVIWVTHEISEIASLASRVVVLDQGRIILDGSTRDVLSNPLLPKLGLDVPLAVEIAEVLKKKGKNVEGQSITLDEIKEQILRLVR